MEPDVTKGPADNNPNTKGEMEFNNTSVPGRNIANHEKLLRDSGIVNAITKAVLDVIQEQHSFKEPEEKLAAVVARTKTYLGKHEAQHVLYGNSTPTAVAIENGYLEAIVQALTNPITGKFNEFENDGALRILVEKEASALFPIFNVCEVPYQDREIVKNLNRSGLAESLKKSLADFEYGNYMTFSNIEELLEEVKKRAKMLPPQIQRDQITGDERLQLDTICKAVVENLCGPSRQAVIKQAVIGDFEQGKFPSFESFEQLWQTIWLIRTEALQKRCVVESAA